MKAVLTGPMQARHRLSGAVVHDQRNEQPMRKTSCDGGLIRSVRVGGAGGAQRLHSAARGQTITRIASPALAATALVPRCPAPPRPTLLLTSRGPRSSLSVKPRCAAARECGAGRGGVLVSRSRSSLAASGDESPLKRAGRGARRVWRRGLCGVLRGPLDHGGRASPWPQPPSLGPWQATGRAGLANGSTSAQCQLRASERGSIPRPRPGPAPFGPSGGGRFQPPILSASDGADGANRASTLRGTEYSPHRHSHSPPRSEAAAGQQREAMGPVMARDGAAALLACCWGWGRGGWTGRCPGGVAASKALPALGALRAGWRHLPQGLTDRAASTRIIQKIKMTNIKKSFYALHYLRF